MLILLGANLCSDDVATSPSRPAGIQGGGGVARYASCRGRSEWHCGLWLGASRNVASTLLHVCGNLQRDHTEEQDRFPIKECYNVGRVAMPVRDWPLGRCGCLSTCAVWRWANVIIYMYFCNTSPWRPARVDLLWEGSSIVMTSWNQDLNQFCYDGRNGSHLAALVLAVSEGNHVCVFCAIF